MAELSKSSTWSAFAEPDLEYTQVIQARGGAPDLFGAKDAAVIRAAIAKHKRPKTAPPAGIKEEDRQIPMRDGQKIAIRVHSPVKPSPGGSPLGVVLHGGGWTIGDLESQEDLCRRMTSELGMTVVNIDYRLAPEHKFPTVLNDCYDATKWAATNASSIGADPSKGFTIGGSSAGGNMACVISHIWKDEGQVPKLTGVHLICPLLCDADSIPEKYASDFQSWNALANADILNHPSIEFCLHNYIPNRRDRADPLFSPLLWKTGHRDLPPHLFQIAGADPVRDESLIYERILREEDGVKTRLHVYTGLPHGFGSVFPKLKSSEKFYEDAMNGFRWILGQNQE